MRYKTLDDFDFVGKRVLVRVDLNSEVEKGKVILGERIIEHSRTILELQKEGAKVIVLAHQGRPGDKDFLPLKQHAKLLNKYVKIKFVDDVIGPKAMKAIAKLKNGDALLLDNVRSLKEEFDKDVSNKFVKSLASVADIYINDAFSISHREQASIVSFPKVLESGIGRVMEHELRSLEHLRVKDAVFILGGAKVEDIILLIKHKPILPGGVLAPLVLMARGYKLGAEEKILKEQLKHLPEIKKNLGNFVEPRDLAVNVEGKRQEVSVHQLPSKYQVLDIGRMTVANYKTYIQKAPAIFFKGTTGYCEDEQFSKGTKELLTAISKAKGFKVLSGGHSTTAMRKFGISKKKFDYISLSGGALAHYMAGERLPGLDALEKGGMR